MEFLRRPLKEREIERCRKRAQRVVGPFFEKEAGISRALNREVSHRYLKKGAILAHGTLQVVVPIGRVKIGSENRSFVVKLASYGGGNLRDQLANVGAARIPSHRDQPNIFKSHASMETKADFFRGLGFPVALHHLIGEIYPHVVGTLSENVSEGAELENAAGFDFKKLRNGNELRAELKGYVAKMAELEKQKILDVDGHISDDDPLLAFKKAFFVRYDAKTLRGQLIMADLDHVFHRVPFEQVSQKFVGLASNYFGLFGESGNGGKRSAGRLVKLGN
ncbi:MAG: hypothetical protein WC792_00395 [Candidatus Micrarchaeia archaeon]|jgi:hypothetical protein